MSVHSSELPPPPRPLSSKRVCPPPLVPTLACGRGGGESQLGRLERKPGTLSTLWYSLFKDEDDLLVVLKDVLEMDDLGGLGADGEQSDLVQHLSGAVHSASNPRQQYFLNIAHGV
jgi:hypothetical protein